MVSATGDWMQITARAFLVYAITGSAGALGIVYFFSYIPQVLFSLPGGALADRADRKMLLVWGTVMQAVVAGVLGVLVLVEAATVWNIAALSFIGGSAMTITITPTLALLPALVPRRALQSAMSLNGTTYSASRVFGPLIAGVMIPVTGTAAVFALNAISFSWVVVAWVRTRTPDVPSSGEESGIEAIRAGLRHARDNRYISAPILLLLLLGLIGFAYQPLAVVYSTEILAAGDEALGGRYYGILQAVMGIGAVVGIMGMGAAGRRRPAMTVLGGAVGFGISLAILGSTGSVVLGMMLGLVVAGLHMGDAVLIQTIVQHEVVDERLRGRMMSLVMLVWIGSIPFASYLWGAVADRVGVSDTLLLSGLASTVLGLVAILWRQRIRMKPIEDDETATLALMAE